SPTHGAPPSSSTAGSNRPGQHPLQGPCPNRWVCAPMVALGLDRHGGVMTVTTCPTTPLTSPLVLRCAAAPRGPWLIQDRRHPGHRCRDGIGPETRRSALSVPPVFFASPSRPTENALEGNRIRWART